MDERSRRMEARFEPVVIFAALLVIPLIAIEESSVGEPWDLIGVALNWATWLVFVGEVVVMLSVVPDRRRWIREHPIEMAVAILTPPFLAALAPVRLLRLLRLVRLLRLARVARRLLSPEGLRSTAFMAAITAVAGGAAFASAEEGRSTAEGIYWALTTMTTVGYGDLAPKTGAGKALAIVVMLVGIGFVAILTGAVAQRFVATDVEPEPEHVGQLDDDAAALVVRELRDVRERLTELERAVQRRGV